MNLASSASGRIPTNRSRITLDCTCSLSFPASICGVPSRRSSLVSVFEMVRKNDKRSL